MYNNTTANGNPSANNPFYQMSKLYLTLDNNPNHMMIKRNYLNDLKQQVLDKLISDRYEAE
jgi:hypothetical protein